MKRYRRLFNWLFNNSTRGAMGEGKIQSSLELLDFFGYDGYCMRNVYLPRESGRTSEIDLLYVTRKGIFVIESKNFSGFIFGNENNRYWTSTLYGGRNWLGFKRVNKYRFYNPIWQNRGHIRAIRECCGSITTFSIVVFGNNCEIKDVSYHSDDVWVCYARNFKRVIREIWNESYDIYDSDTVKSIYHDLSQSNGSDTVVRENHIQSTQDVKNGKVCPLCGGKLVIRTAKQGHNAGHSFLGCTNYPNCRYTRNIERN